MMLIKFLILLLPHISMETHILNSCTGRQLESWNYKNVAQHLKMWLQSMITVGGNGLVKTLVFRTKNNSFGQVLMPGEQAFPEKHPSLFDRENKMTIGKVDNQRPVGLAWQWIGNQIWDGFLYGHVNNFGWFTGNNITFVYPDFLTGISGIFKNGKLVEGIEVKVVAQRCHDGIKELKLKNMKKYANINWKAEEINSTFMTSMPEVMDPHERKSVYIKKSSYVNITSYQEGLFTKKTFTAGELISYFNGMRGDYNEFVPPYMTDEEETDATVMLHDLTYDDKDYPENYCLSVPPSHRSFGNYRTTLGHKANHKFDGNAYYTKLDHIVYGRIVGAIANTYIQKNEEVFADYGYHIDSAPDWYKEEYNSYYGVKLESLP